MKAEQNIESELDRELDKHIQNRTMPPLHIWRYAVTYRPTKHKILLARLGQKKREGER